MQSYALAPFSGLLQRMANKLPPNERKRAADKPVDGRTLNCKYDLTDAQVIEARAAFDSGEKVRVLALRYGVNYQRMSKIVNGYHRTSVRA